MTSKMNCYVYVIEGSNGFTYVGQTNDIADRLARHNGNRSKSTKGRGPFKLIYTETFGSRSEAVSREGTLKTGKGRKWIHDNLLKR